MSIARRSFLKSATMTTLSAGLALGIAQSIFGQRGRNEETRSTRRDRRGDPGDDFQTHIPAQQDALVFFRAAPFRPYVCDYFQDSNSRAELIELILSHVS